MSATLYSILGFLFTSLSGVSATSIAFSSNPDIVLYKSNLIVVRIPNV